MGLVILSAAIGLVVSWPRQNGPGSSTPDLRWSNTEQRAQANDQWLRGIPLEPLPSCPALHKQYPTSWKQTRCAGKPAYTKQEQQLLFPGCPLWPNDKER